MRFKKLFYEENDPFQLIKDLPDNKKILKIIVDMDLDRDNKKLQNNLTKLLKPHKLKWQWYKGENVPVKIVKM